MKKKATNPNDVSAVMAQIQEQLAVLDRKFDQFMTKSLKDIADVLAASKPAQVVHVPAPSVARTNDRPARQMYAVVCFDCGKDTEIPFKPSGDRPVYCKECFAKRKAGQAPKPNTAPSLQPREPEAATTAATVEKSPSSKKKTAAKKATARKTTAKKAAKRK